ncbi:MAG: Arginine--tRNA ligase [Tenericutes bacterium ADurb.BinA155]|jgi:arginyl-tRNA synthetase|nr:MAG: Arginine--tRNA ligase [Tenericutes bacterium ADurb.BinA155]
MDNEIELKNALIAAGKSLGLELKPEDVVIEHSKDPVHGDYSSNVALKYARVLKKSPKEIAESFQKSIQSPIISKIEVAGPGFINFFIKQDSLTEVVSQVLAQGSNYGKGPDKHFKIDVEFVSANPTGDLHLGHTRCAAIGDCICNLYTEAGYSVTREYYVNDCGNQIEHLGHSIRARYHEQFGEPLVLGEDDYHGVDLIDLAKEIKAQYGDKYLQDDAASHDFFIRFGIDHELAKIKKDMADFGVHWDVFSYESDIRKGSTIPDTIKGLEKYTYVKDGATYLKTTAFLDDKDRPIVKSNGQYTYFMPDIAYHYGKMARGFDLLIDVLGSDHHGYLNRMKSALMMKGYPESCIDFELVQVVRVFKDGQEVKMSKRTGKSITHRELVADVGKDAVRYFFVERSASGHLDFNFNLAMEQSNSNPVYYAQYAHARCHSLLEMAGDIPLDPKAPLLKEESEMSILKHLSDFPSMIEAAAKERAPYKVAGYIQKLATLIHEFYAACRVIDRDNIPLTSSRLALIKSCMIVLENALGLLGVSAPDKM